MVHKWRRRVEAGRLRSRGPRRGGIHAAPDLYMATALVSAKANTSGDVQYRNRERGTRLGQGWSSRGRMAAPNCPQGSYSTSTVLTVDGRPMSRCERLSDTAPGLCNVLACSWHYVFGAIFFMSLERQV